MFSWGIEKGFIYIYGEFKAVLSRKTHQISKIKNFKFNIQPLLRRYQAHIVAEDVGKEVGFAAHGKVLNGEVMHTGNEQL